VAAGLPVLQALRVTGHGRGLGRGGAAVGEQRGDLRHGGVLELLHPRRQQVAHQVGGTLRPVAEEVLEHQHRAFAFSPSSVTSRW
jgi:hypothetical protein